MKLLGGRGLTSALLLLALTTTKAAPLRRATPTSSTSAAATSATAATASSSAPTATAAAASASASTTATEAPTPATTPTATSTPSAASTATEAPTPATTPTATSTPSAASTATSTAPASPSTALALLALADPPALLCTTLQYRAHVGLTAIDVEDAHGEVGARQPRQQEVHPVFAHPKVSVAQPRRLLLRHHRLSTWRVGGVSDRGKDKWQHTQLDQEWKTAEEAARTGAATRGV
ncbi:unnamed protein product [Closterium sp. NIES-64]|nr:unnamed protein product [Closterium sp. NIES-64]